MKIKILFVFLVVWLALFSNIVFAIDERIIKEKECNSVLYLIILVISLLIVFGIIILTFKFRKRNPIWFGGFIGALIGLCSFTWFGAYFLLPTFFEKIFIKNCEISGGFHTVLFFIFWGALIGWLIWRKKSNKPIFSSIVIAFLIFFIISVVLSSTATKIRYYDVKVDLHNKYLSECKDINYEEYDCVNNRLLPDGRIRKECYCQDNEYKSKPSFWQVYKEKGLWRFSLLSSFIYLVILIICSILTMSKNGEKK